MVFKISRIASIVILAAFALSSAAAAASCSNASLSGPYGLLHNGTDSTGAPATAAVSQLTFDSTTGTFSGETTASHGGVLVTSPLSGTYTISANCTGTGTPAAGNPFSIVVTSTGFLAVHPLSEGFALKQGLPRCSDAGVQGRYGFEATGNYLAGAPALGPVAFIGELHFTVDDDGNGVITGRIAGAEGAAILDFADEPVLGSYKVGSDCRGTAEMTPQGYPAMHFHLVVVDSEKEILAIETDPDTIVSGTLVKNN